MHRSGHSPGPSCGSGRVQPLTPCWAQPDSHTAWGEPLLSPPRPVQPGQLQVCPQSPIPRTLPLPGGTLLLWSCCCPGEQRSSEGWSSKGCLILPLSLCILSLPALWASLPSSPSPAFQDPRISLSFLLRAQPRAICRWLMSPGTADKRGQYGRVCGSAHGLEGS